MTDDQLRQLLMTQTKAEERKYRHYLRVYLRHKGGKIANNSTRIHIIHCIRVGVDPMEKLGIKPDHDELIT